MWQDRTHTDIRFITIWWFLKSTYFHITFSTSLLINTAPNIILYINCHVTVGNVKRESSAYISYRILLFSKLAGTNNTLQYDTTQNSNPAKKKHEFNIDILNLM